MKYINIKIDGKEILAQEGTTVLEAAQKNGIFIPTLCYLETLIPYGGCRLCLVEVVTKNSSKLVVSCVYNVEENLVVNTKSEKIDRIRKTIIELLLAHAPNSSQLNELAQQYGADKNRFPKEANFCVHCGLCVRYCNEIKKLNVVGFIDRGVRKEICFVPELAAKECETCKECFPLCPTSYLQATYVLTQGLTFSNSPVPENN